MDRPYVEIVFEGSPEGVKALVGDLVRELGRDTEYVYLSREVGIEGTSRIHRFLAKAHVATDHVHLLVPAEHFPVFRAAPLGDLKIIAAHEVIEKHFDFSFECYNRDHAAVIKKIFSDLPEGVALEGFSPRELEDESAKGAELYSPTHDYEFTGKGTAKGPVRGLLALKKAAQDEPLIDVGEVRIVLGKDLLDGDA
ncbi:MAG: hypothetical protein M5R36_11810 [Deltaproteobacteria bacterium]|nr:hypothetical protein [Deltaproteobacteria bacterium]